MTLTEFLLARIAEDETPVETTSHVHYCPVSSEGADAGECYGPEAGCVPWTAHPSTRVLAECEAKRQIVADFELLHRDYQVTHDPTTEVRRFQALVAASRLASVYADHPDFNPEWKP